MKSPVFEKIIGFLKGIWFLWSACLLINIITFFLIKFKIHPGNGTPLRYNILEGVEWYGQGKNLYLIPGVGTMALLANFFVFKKLREENSFLAFLAAFVTLCIELILLVAILFLTSIN